MYSAPVKGRFLPARISSGRWDILLSVPLFVSSGRLILLFGLFVSILTISFSVPIISGPRQRANRVLRKPSNAGRRQPSARHAGPPDPPAAADRVGAVSGTGEGF